MTNEYFFDSSFTFAQLDGFAVAAAVTTYDGSPDPIEDPTIGSIKLYVKQWGLQDNPGIFFAPVKTRPCRITDFEFENQEDGQGDSESLFYTVNSVSERDLKTYWRKMKCIDELSEDYVIQGSYNTDKA